MVDAYFIKFKNFLIQLEREGRSIQVVESYIVDLFP